MMELEDSEISLERAHEILDNHREYATRTLMRAVKRLEKDQVGGDA